MSQNPDAATYAPGTVWFLIDKKVMIMANEEKKDPVMGWRHEVHVLGDTSGSIYRAAQFALTPVSNPNPNPQEKGGSHDFLTCRLMSVPWWKNEREL